jgi:hypothetical protein
VDFLRENGVISDQMAATLNVAMRPMVDRAYGPAPAQGPGWQAPRLADLGSNIGTPVNVAPATGPANLVPAATNTLKVWNQVQNLLPQGGGLAKAGALLPKGKKR